MAAWLLAVALLESGGGPHALGDTVRLELPVPDGWTVEEPQPDSTYALLWHRGDSIAVMPLVTDTLRLPAIRALRDGDTLYLELPDVAVTGTMPDSSWQVGFPRPLDPRIPEGLPADYLQRHRWWAAMGKPAAGWWPWAAAGGLLLGLLTFFLVRRRKSGEGEPEDHSPAGLAERVEALLHHPAFASGDWEELYAEYDRLLRGVIDRTAGTDSDPLTFSQIGAFLRGSRSGRELWEQAQPLAREVVMQRYAGWGSSRERAAAHIRRLKALAERWCSA